MSGISAYRHRPQDPVEGMLSAQLIAANAACGSVHRIWVAHGLEPHRIRTFKNSRDAQLVDRLKDVSGSTSIRPPMIEGCRLQFLRLDAMGDQR
jgi:hypothetical protein